MRVQIFHRESGQAVVEAAIVLPLFIAAILGILQLALLQQARLLTEYAAFQAARAGVVWQGDPRKMKDAAIFSLAPTACPTKVPAVGALCAGRKTDSEWARQAAAIAALQALSQADELIFPGVHVHILNPWWPAHGDLFKVGLGQDELDFDTLPANGLSSNADEAARVRSANILTLQVQYWFELKIPFVDRMIWEAWRLLRKAKGFDDDEINRGDGYRLVRDESFFAATAAAAAPIGSRAYFIPLVAHHSMRMQSNFAARHIRGCSCSHGSGCTAECRAW